MFTGIIEEQGLVVKLEKQRNLCSLIVKTQKIARTARLGESIAVDGVCLTVAGKQKSLLKFDMMKETLAATTMRFLKAGQKVNLEQALKANSRFGGHFVTGHTDGVGILFKKISARNYQEYWIKVPRALMRYVVPKGSVAVNGVSLTVGKIRANTFSVYLIPFTLKVTTLGFKKISDRVNVEADLIAKYLLK